MEINWFPGHMAKSTREIESALKIADCVVYVLDSRAVRSCFNPKFDEMIKVPIVYVINKADAAPADIVTQWVKKLSTGGNTAIATNGTESISRGKLASAIKAVCAPTLDRQKKRGLNAHIRAAVVGVPNTGKSTLINSLCGKARLTTGNRAGVTRAATWARVDETLDVLDTPGTLYPKITDRRVGENLAIIGSIRDEVLDVTEIAAALISRLDEIDGTLLSARYGEITGSYGRLEQIAIARGYKIRGGEPDYERAAATVVDDFRKGRLGKIALEKADEK
ncbi:MAG: ribosome biogenesis GTPase YlqF [Clostridiales bacterium]|nr:ribosome biogenesis GTPase YlqF [Clostridiales bacterium]